MYKIQDFVIYPRIGVGQITEIREENIQGHLINMFIVEFESEPTQVRIPVDKAEGRGGIRKPSTREVMGWALNVLKTEARLERPYKKSGHAAREYSAKLETGEPLLIAEVVADLHPPPNQPFHHVYDDAVRRLTQELAVVCRISNEEASSRIEAALDNR